MKNQVEVFENLSIHAQGKTNGGYSVRTLGHPIDPETGLTSRIVAIVHIGSDGQEVAERTARRIAADLDPDYTFVSVVTGRQYA